MSQKSSRREGFSLIFAVLISATLVTIGAAMANLALKEYNIVGTTRASQTAFYGADAGTECALYYDFQGSNFIEPSGCNAGTSVCTVPSPFQITCSDPLNPISVSVSDDQGNADRMSSITGGYRVHNRFQFSYNGSCVTVTVTKFDPSVSNTYLESWGITEPDGYGVQTIIESRATNVACGANKAPIQVERALRVNY